MCNYEIANGSQRSTLKKLYKRNCNNHEHKLIIFEDGKILEEFREPLEALTKMSPNTHRYVY
jgi:hypothetical protein